MKISKNLLGAIVRVTFQDHSIGTTPGETITCNAYGEVFKIAPKMIILRYWHCVSADAGNDEFVNIVKASIKGLTVYQTSEKKESKGEI